MYHKLNEYLVKTFHTFQKINNLCEYLPFAFLCLCQLSQQCCEIMMKKRHTRHHVAGMNKDMNLMLIMQTSPENTAAKENNKEREQQQSDSCTSTFRQALCYWWQQHAKITRNTRQDKDMMGLSLCIWYLNTRTNFREGVGVQRFERSMCTTITKESLIDMKCQVGSWQPCHTNTHHFSTELPKKGCTKFEALSYSVFALLSRLYSAARQLRLRNTWKTFHLLNSWLKAGRRVAWPHITENPCRFGVGGFQLSFLYKTGRGGWAGIREWQCKFRMVTNASKHISSFPGPFKVICNQSQPWDISTFSDRLLVTSTSFCTVFK